MKMSLRTQLLLIFTTVIVLIIGAVSLVTVALTNDHFDKYVTQRNSTTLATIRQQIALSYVNNHDQWQAKQLREIRNTGYRAGVLVTIYAPDGRILMRPTAKQQQSVSTGFDRKHTESIRIQGKVVANAVFSGYDPLGYGRHDVEYVSELKTSLITIAVITFMVTIVIAWWLAGRLTAPIKRVVAFTGKVATGNYQQPLPANTRITEIITLLESVNALSGQLNRQQETREQLSSDIAHELRTPLTMLQGTLEAMIDGVWEISTERLQNMDEEVIRLTHLIKNIELIASIETDADQLHKARFDIGAMVDAVTQNFQAKLEAKQQRITVATRKIMMYGDEEKLRQVLLNLLTNASKFSDFGATIQVRLMQESANAVIQVIDSGIGIDAKELVHIFDHFYMADPARSSRNGGQGIGLAMVKTIVAAHGGAVKVDSQLMKGSTFTVELPIQGGDDHR